MKSFDCNLTEDTHPGDEELFKSAPQLVTQLPAATQNLSKPKKGLREVKKSKIIHLVKSTVPSPMQPGLRAAKVADIGSIWASPCCDLFICMMIVLCIDGDCFVVDLS